jgi:hypothetical protein
MSIKNFSDNIENRTRDLPTCSKVPQPTAPPRVPTSPEEASKNRTVSKQWIVHNVKTTGRALILSTASAFAKISNRELPNV